MAHRVRAGGGTYEKVRHEIISGIGVTLKTGDRMRINCSSQADTWALPKPCAVEE